MLRDLGRQLQADKAVLEAKLKEALSVQPAAVDPRELAKAEEKIRNLLKENDLLKVSLDQAKAKPADCARYEGFGRSATGPGGGRSQARGANEDS